MTTIQLNYFGDINYTNLTDYYRTKTTYDGNILQIDLNFKENYISSHDAAELKEFLEKIDFFNDRNRSEINKDLDNCGETKEYINFFLDEFEEDELKEIIHYKKSAISIQKQFLSKLKLIRVGLYPNQNYYGVFDYSIEIDGDICNQILVVKTDSKGELNHITWES